MGRTCRRDAEGKEAEEDFSYDDWRIKITVETLKQMYGRTDHWHGWRLPGQNRGLESLGGDIAQSYWPDRVM